MAFGLEIYNASSQKTLQVTESLTKYVGAFSLSDGAANGSAVYPDLAGGRPFATVLRNPVDYGSNGAADRVPLVTFSGTTVYWTYSSPYNRSGCRIVLGVY
jgi:hypothetical protein